MKIKKLHVIVRKEVDLSGLFGKFKTKKSAQKLKKETQKFWG